MLYEFNFLRDENVKGEFHVAIVLLGHWKLTRAVACMSSI